MQNNPNQEIHTKYNTNDVFKPMAANQLARTNVYDFVITQEMFDKYLTRHPGAGTVSSLDVGDLIASDIDGEAGSWPQMVPAPVSIFIEADTGDTSLNFNGRLVYFDGGSSGCIVDCSEFANSNGERSIPETDGCINVYAAHPYKISSIDGGVNYWSTPEVPVELPNYFGANGICRVGAYTTENGSNLDFGSRPGGVGPYLELICQRAVGTGRVICSPSEGQAQGAYYAPVYYADWMSGASSSNPAYRINDTDTSKPGLFQQIQKSLENHTMPVLAVCNTSVYTRSEVPYTYAGPYSYSQDTPDSYIFTNSGAGYSYIVRSDTTVTRIRCGGAGSNIIDVGYLNEGSTNNPPSDDFLDALDEMLSAGMAPVIGWSEVTGHRPGEPGEYRRGTQRYAHFAGVGCCSYMFHDVYKNTYIRIRGGTNILRQMDTEPYYGAD